MSDLEPYYPHYSWFVGSTRLYSAPFRDRCLIHNQLVAQSSGCATRPIRIAAIYHSLQYHKSHSAKRNPLLSYQISCYYVGTRGGDVLTFVDAIFLARNMLPEALKAPHLVSTFSKYNVHLNPEDRTEF